jgi:hypothetical protein
MEAEGSSESYISTRLHGVTCKGLYCSQIFWLRSGNFWCLLFCEIDFGGSPVVGIVSACGNGKAKVKAIPLQAWTGPEGSRKLRLSDF